MGVHAKLAPSASHRWLKCSGCIDLCEQLEPIPSSKYAMEGSAAHYLAEKCLTSQRGARHMLGRKITVDCDVTKELHRFPVTEEMADAVQVFLDEVNRKRAAVSGGVFTIEERLDLTWLAPDLFGTGDHTIVEPLGRVYVDDYKHGKGVWVDVNNNPQLMIYGLGAVGEGNPNMVEEVEVTITQPRIVYKNSPLIRSVVYDVEELQAWGREILKPGALLALSGEGKLIPGEWCHWCLANDRSACPEIRSQVLLSADAMFGDDLVPTKPTATLKNPATMDGDQLSRMLEFLPIYDIFKKAVYSEAYDRLTKGVANAPTNFKLVESLGNTKWIDEAAAAKKFKPLVEDAYMPSKLKSPSQMTAALKKAGYEATLLEGMTERPKGEPKMVPRSDPAAELPPPADQMFEVIDPFEGDIL